MVPSFRAVALLILLGVPWAAGEACWTTSSPEINTTQPGIRGPSGGALYVDLDRCGPVGGAGTCFTGHLVVYEESNGIGGLQRDDAYRSDVGACGPETGVVADTRLAAWLLA